MSTNGFEQISISNIDQDGCNVMFLSGNVPDDLVLTIWIGAIGPLTGKAALQPGTVVRLAFDEPLDERVTRHFACS